jgi:hypothetical protein
MYVFHLPFFKNNKLNIKLSAAFLKRVVSDPQNVYFKN